MGWVRLDRPRPVTWLGSRHAWFKLPSPCFLLLQQEMQKKREKEGLTWRWRRRRRRWRWKWWSCLENVLLSFALVFFFFFVMGSPFLWFFFGFLFPCVLLSFSRSLLFFPSSPLATHWPFIGAESTVCSPVRLFFPWQRISPAGTWILDSILIFSRIVILCRVNRLRVWMERKHQQSCHCWTVGGRLWLGLQRRVRRWSLIGLGTLADQNQFVPACVELST